MTDEIPWNAQQRKAKHRELFDTANRVQFAEFIREKALDPDITMSTSDKLRAVYFHHAETTWDSFREELQFRSDAEVKEALDVFRAKEAELGGQEPKTLMDPLQAGGLFLNADTPQPGQGEVPRAVRDTTRNLVEAVLLDVWPRSGAIVDFGLKSQEHYEALYYPLRHGDFTPEQVDAAMGNGRKLTELVSAAAHNPHKGIEFHTDWDGLLPEPEHDGDGPPERKQEESKAGLDDFDRVVANVRQQWYEDGFGDGVETWEEQSAVEKVGFVAGYAARHNVSFERFVVAAGRTLDMEPGQEFTGDELEHLRCQFRWAHDDYSDDGAGVPSPSMPMERVPSPREIARENSTPSVPERDHGPEKKRGR